MDGASSVLNGGLSVSYPAGGGIAILFPFNLTFTFPATSEDCSETWKKRKRDLLEIIYTDKSDAMRP